MVRRPTDGASAPSADADAPTTSSSADVSDVIGRMADHKSTSDQRRLQPLRRKPERSEAWLEPNEP